MKNKTLIPVCFALFFMSCSLNKKMSVEGYISHIEGRYVTVEGNTFQVANADSLYVGKWVTFIGTTRNDKRINSKRSN